MIKTKDGYIKLIGTTYQGSSSYLLQSNGEAWAVHSSRNNEANKIVRTDANGYLNTGWINTISGDMGTTTATRIYCSNDGYIRYKTPDDFFSVLTNDGIQLSITIGSYNRKLTVNYSNYSGYSNYLAIHDIRGTNPTPSDCDDKRIKAWFNNTGTPNSDWWSGITVKGWTSGYAVWQLAGYSSTTSMESHLYYRRGLGTSWGSWRTILDSSNYTTYVKKLGTSTVGGAVTPIYLSSGSPTVCSSSTSATANSIAVRDSSGDLQCRLVRSNFANQDTISGALAYRVSTTDNYIRFCSNIAAIRSWLGVPASSHTHTLSQISDLHSSWDAILKALVPSTWKPQITKSIDWNNIFTDSYWGFFTGYTNSPISGLSVMGISIPLLSASNYGMQLAARNNNIFFRTKENSTIQTWQELYHTGNKPTWNDISNKPSTFTPSSHTHPYLPLAGGTMNSGATIKLSGTSYLIQNQNSSSNYTTILKWYKGGESQATYDPSIGQHNTGGDGTGSIVILPYATDTSPQGGSVGLFIAKNTLKLDGKSIAFTSDIPTVPTVTNYYWANIKVSASSSTSTSPTFATATMTRGVVGRYNNTSYALSTSSFICNSWIRTNGAAGWYSQTYGGGIYMKDSTYVRTYNSKKFYSEGGYHTPYTGGQWIAMATRNDIISGDTNQTTSTAHGLFRVKNSDGDAIVFGGLGKNVGFYGFSAENISSNNNSTSWTSYWDVSTGDFYSNHYINSVGFKRTGSSNNYVLLGGGGHKAVSDFALNTDVNILVENGYILTKTTIDASSLNVNTYYPVTFSIESRPNVRIECIVSLDSDTKPSWSTHAQGFSVRKIWEVNGDGYGINEINRRILVSDYRFANSDPVRGIGQLTHSSTEYVYVRGGGKYHFYISHNITPVLRTSSYTISGQTISPYVSSYPSYESGIPEINSSWGKSINMTIGNVTKSVNGSGDIIWPFTELKVCYWSLISYTSYGLGSELHLTKNEIGNYSFLGEQTYEPYNPSAFTGVVNRQINFNNNMTYNNFKNKIIIYVWYNKDGSIINNRIDSPIDNPVQLEDDYNSSINMKITLYGKNTNYFRIFMLYYL